MGVEFYASCYLLMLGCILSIADERRQLCAYANIGTREVPAKVAVFMEYSVVESISMHNRSVGLDS